MPEITRKTNECIIIAGADGAEQVLKIEIAEINADRVLLKIEERGGLSAHSLESWQMAETKHKASRSTDAVNRPKARPPYMS